MKGYDISLAGFEECCDHVQGLNVWIIAENLEQALAAIEPVRDKITSLDVMDDSYVNPIRPGFNWNLVEQPGDAAKLQEYINANAITRDGAALAVINGTVNTWNAEEKDFRDTGLSVEQFSKSNAISEVEQRRLGIARASRHHEVSVPSL
ncbi:hypothetical protein ACYPKM_04615 [Pseudomonas aeruginosa]